VVGQALTSTARAPRGDDKQSRHACHHLQVRARLGQQHRHDLGRRLIRSPYEPRDRNPTGHQ
jgi:hypothetical protein